jgi:protein SCO1
MSHVWGMRRMRTMIASFSVFACLGFLAACGPSRSAKQGDIAQGNDTGVKRYPLTGRVVSVDKANHSINVDGDAIPGFMSAMTMPYQVKDASVLATAAPGDQIKADIVLANDGAYLESVVLAQKAASPSPTK